MKLILFLISTLIITSCSLKTQKSPLKVTFGAASAAFSGNLIVFGKNNQGHSFIREVTASDDSFSVDLNNGIWNFAAIGWEGSNNFEGDSFCEAIGPFNLNGNEKSINLITTKAKCARPVFGGHGNANGLLPLTFTSCLNIKNKLLNEGPASAPGDIICNGSMDKLDGGAKSVKISLLTGDMTPNGTTFNQGVIESQCFDVNSSQVNTPVKLPFGSSGFKLPYVVKTYNSASCTNADLADVYNYYQSFTQVSTGQAGGASVDTLASLINVILHADACLAAQENNRPFATPDTSGGSKTYMICNADQFMNIFKSSCLKNDGNSASWCSDIGSKYILGQDIDLTSITPGTDAYIEADFEGSIDGADFKISNGTKPLFKKITGANDIKIESLNIDSFTIAADINSGVLANSVLPTGSSNYAFKKIKVTNSSITLTTGTSYYIGGLIGTISTAAGTELVIEDSIFDIDLDAVTYGSAGGVVGKITNATSATVSLSNNVVGSSLSRVSMNATQTTVSAITQADGLGGLVGVSLLDLNLDGNKTYIQATGRHNIGGFIGKHSNATSLRISNSYSDITYDHSGDSDVTRNIGGFIGMVVNSNLDIKDSNSNFKFESDYTPSSATTALNNQYIGGLVGLLWLGVSPSKDVFIQNISANIDIKTNGDAIGGFFGNFSSALYANPNIKDSQVRGSIKPEDNTKGTNSFRGGVVGNSSHLNIERMIIQVEIEGHKSLGGISGAQMTSKTLSAKDIYIKNTITSNKASAIMMGAISGRVPNSAGNNLENIFVDTVLNHEATNSCFGSSIDMIVNCGALIGKADNDIGSQIEDVVAIVTENYNGGSATATATSSTNHISSNSTQSSADINFSVTTNCASSSYTSFTGYSLDPDSGNCMPTFYTNWVAFGASKDLNDNYILNDDASLKIKVGNNLEPFELSSRAQWNDIGDKSSLMSKAFALTNNINFSLGINPIGTDNNPFAGTIIPNGNKLLNIDHTFSGTESNAGVFMSTDSARIGLRDDILKIENIDLEFNNALIEYAGFVGEAINTDIHVEIFNGTYFDTTVLATSSIGGIVGHVKNRSDIVHSGFNGSLYLPNTKFVGGIVGSVNNETNTKADMEISESYVVLKKIKAITTSGFSGGFIGGFNTSSPANAPSVSITKSYLRFNLNAAADVAKDEFGSIIGHLHHNIDFHKSFVDFKNPNSLDLDDLRPDSKAGSGAGVIDETGSGLIGTFATQARFGNPLAISTSSTDLIDSNNNFSTDGNDWSLDNNGNLIHDWQINGFDN